MAGKTIAAVETVQPKCLNVSPAEMESLLLDTTIAGARERGKWLVLDLGRGAATGEFAPAAHLLLNLGMGGDFYYVAAPGAGLAAAPATPEKYQFRLSFTDGAQIRLRFWWFGYVHVVRAGELSSHEMTASLGPSPLDPDMNLDRFRDIVRTRPRRGVKSLLMDQRLLAGIGNVYVQDSLWGARLHPDRLLGTLSPAEVEALWISVRDVLSRSIGKGGLAYERDLYGRAGGYGREDYGVAYKPGQPCPRCGAVIVKIRTGTTSTFICPACQKA